METKIYYRVRPEYLGYSHEDFENLPDAIKRCNERNSIREKEGAFKGTFYKGDNCKIQKVTIIIEDKTTKNINIMKKLLQAFISFIKELPQGAQYALNR